MGGIVNKRGPYKNMEEAIHRGDAEDEETMVGSMSAQEESKTDKKHCKCLEDYVRVVNKNTELYSTYPPSELEQALIDFAKEEGIKYKVN